MKITSARLALLTPDTRQALARAYPLLWLSNLGENPVPSGHNALTHKWENTEHPGIQGSFHEVGLSVLGYAACGVSNC